jgi:hypothetical protein
LPFADDIRKINYQADKPDQECINVAMNMINKMTLEMKYPKNPAIEKHFAYLKAVVMESSELEVTPDSTLPSEDIFNRCGKEIDLFNRVTFILMRLPGKRLR